MKKFLGFTILLLSSFSKVLACGYSPYGEDVRYCIFKPAYFNYKDYASFYYNTDSWGFENGLIYGDRKPSYYTANVEDWYAYTNKTVSIDVVNDFINNLKLTDIHAGSGNGFIQYLFKNNKKDAIEYLKIAKQCEDVNSWGALDAWEREEIQIDAQRVRILNKVVSKYNQEKSAYFKRKYAFLAIRLAYYANDFKIVQKLFRETFENSTQDYLYYWATFFNSYTKSEGERLVDAARLMANSPEKFEASYFYFHDTFSVAKALRFAKTKEDVANIYAYASIQKADRNLEYLKQIYQNHPKSRILGFLLLREVNKIEDWVFTPYYTNYEPTTGPFSGVANYDDTVTTLILRERSEKDRIYASEMLGFMNTVNFSETYDPVVWQSSKIQLLFIARKYEECRAEIQDFERKFKKNAAFEIVEKIKALCVIADQDYGNAVIKDEAKPIILKYNKDERFMFALGRELEFKGDLPDGLAIIATANQYNIDYYYDIEGVEWQGNRNKASGNLEYFYTYFDYLDFVYSADELQLVINALNAKRDSQFDRVIYKQLLADKESLTDLLGTKYLREDRLTAALKTFKSLPQKYWDDNYNGWERGIYSDYYAFDQNPFYEFKHTEDFIKKDEKYLLSKLTVTEHLIKYLNLANNPKTKDRDYYYFLAANCYFNMSSAGNSWMMRRYNSSNGYYDDEVFDNSYIDEKEYRHNEKAVSYYQLAYENAKTDKFKALCLRMREFAEYSNLNAFKELKKEFPQYHEDLSNCNNLASYFNSRR
ncbi:hypothetical protein [Flavobacterium pedocola]